MEQNLPYADKELLDLIRDHDSQEAFVEFYHRYQYRIFGFLLKITGSQQITEDLVQDIFLKLWKNRRSFPEIVSPGPYLFRMAQNHAINAFRRMAHETLLKNSLRTASEPVADPAAEHMISLREAESLLDQAIEALPPRQKIIYRLSREEGLRYEEIALRLGIASGTVKNHLIRASQAIREQLKKHPDVLMLLFVAGAITCL